MIYIFLSEMEKKVIFSRIKELPADEKGASTAFQLGLKPISVLREVLAYVVFAAGAC